MVEIDLPFAVEETIVNPDNNFLLFKQVHTGEYLPDGTPHCVDLLHIEMIVANQAASSSIKGGVRLCGPPAGPAPTFAPGARNAAPLFAGQHPQAPNGVKRNHCEHQAHFFDVAPEDPAAVAHVPPVRAHQAMEHTFPQGISTALATFHQPAVAMMDVASPSTNKRRRVLVPTGVVPAVTTEDDDEDEREADYLV